MKKRISFFTISMLLGSITYAGVAVNPVQLYIRDTAKQKSTTLTVESIDETEKKIFEIKGCSLKLQIKMFLQVEIAKGVHT